jgi:hypothetical protein
VPLFVLQSIDDWDTFAEVAAPQYDEWESLYLWALSRNRMRQLVTQYIDESGVLDDDTVTTKIVSDIDAINAHRTPLNCLMFLRLVEDGFDDSPVNRTELIGRVLFLVFCQYDKIPTYASRPDLKDCEYALGRVCEWLIREGKASFSKSEFGKLVREFATEQVLELDVDVLFTFLASENIIVRRGSRFEFRLVYWLHYFAAHRMHHSPEFATYIFEDARYASLPEIIEFYTGIDRRRTDAVERIAADLQQMNAQFSERTSIPEGFDPFSLARWEPDADGIQAMKRLLADGASGSSLPAGS